MQYAGPSTVNNDAQVLRKKRTHNRSYPNILCWTDPNRSVHLRPKYIIATCLSSNDDYNLFKEKVVARIPKRSTPSCLSYVSVSELNFKFILRRRLSTNCFSHLPFQQRCHAGQLEKEHYLLASADPSIGPMVFARSRFIRKAHPIPCTFCKRCLHQCFDEEVYWHRPMHRHGQQAQPGVDGCWD